MNPALRNRVVVFFAVIVAGLIFLAPTVLRDSMPKTWISKPISLGLDLSGGVSLVYEVQTNEAVKSHLQNIGNTARSELRNQKVGVTKVKATDKDQLELTLLTTRNLDQAKQYLDDNYRRDLTFVEQRDEDGRVVLVYGVSADQEQQIKTRAVAQAVETLRTRVDQFGVSEPLIQTAGEDRIVLQMPGVSDIEAVKRVVGSVAKLEFRLVPVPGSGVATITLKNREGVPEQVEDEVLMTGDAVETAQAAFPNGRFEVALSMTSEGTKLMRKISGDNVGRQLAIILDGVVYSAPVLREAIPNGKCSISGGDINETEARELAVVLRSGALPAPLKIMEERTVGPSLGLESIRAGEFAIVVGYVLIVIFMAVYYRKSGWVANFSLLLNLFLCVAGLSAFGATLTLPGLAGLALTIGMAVDSNVIIFERIREEIDRGVSRDAAVEAGFKNGWRTIIDTHVTTLLSGVVLYFLGTGSIKGFAVTLTVGIAATLYCATFGSRLVFDVLPLRGKEKGLSI